jgi:class 3 adenylate cyclase
MDSVELSNAITNDYTFTADCKELPHQCDTRRSTMDSIEFINSITKGDTDTQYHEFTNVCICMIDIVGFSAWCSNHMPQTITYSMVQYNTMICDLIIKYPNLSKIELVGDCCMIRSESSHTWDEFILNGKEIISFASDIINSISFIHTIFKSTNIGVRIGIHIGDVIGLIIENPYKYQLFGNDINICSRLESRAIKNTIHISEKLFFVFKLDDVWMDQFVISDKLWLNYKGVGEKASYMLLMRKNMVLFVEFKHTHRMMAKLPGRCVCLFENNLVASDNMKSYRYRFVCVNLFDFYTNAEIEAYLVLMHNKWNNMKIVILCKNYIQYTYVQTYHCMLFDALFDVNRCDFKERFMVFYDASKY